MKLRSCSKSFCSASNSARPDSPKDGPLSLHTKHPKEVSTAARTSNFVSAEEIPRIQQTQSVGACNHQQRTKLQTPPQQQHTEAPSNRQTLFFLRPKCYPHAIIKCCHNVLGWGCISQSLALFWPEFGLILALRKTLDSKSWNRIPPRPSADHQQESQARYCAICHAITPTLNHQSSSPGPSGKKLPTGFHPGQTPGPDDAPSSAVQSQGWCAC
jgi:hypothetical protein